ncbi:MAG: glycosyltransferase [Phycisphaerales bacterium]|nr:glycosyltransferase [Phycisphaerales bacterium]
MDLSLVIPTHNRAGVLAETLEKLARLDDHTVGDRCELIIVDNGSDHPPEPPKSLGNGIEIRVILLPENRSAAARNIGAHEARGDWIVMLDDDSSLERSPAVATLRAMPADVHVVGGEIFLPDGKHESGGLPEVVIGCGCAYRTHVFNALGGYDPSFDFYAEEYDLCARILLGGGRVVHSAGLRFEHRKSAQNRSFERIIHRLVRNNGWVIRRYTPTGMYQTAMDQMIERYRWIAEKEHVLPGFDAGLEELTRTIEGQPSRAMDPSVYERFIGRAACEGQLRRVLGGSTDPVRIVCPGKGEDVVRGVLAGLGVRVLGGDKPVARAVIGTLSPGPMHDAQLMHSEAILPFIGFHGPVLKFS